MKMLLPFGNNFGRSTTEMEGYMPEAWTCSPINSADLRTELQMRICVSSCKTKYMPGLMDGAMTVHSWPGTQLTWFLNLRTKRENLENMKCIEHCLLLKAKIYISSFVNSFIFSENSLCALQDSTGDDYIFSKKMGRTTVSIPQILLHCDSQINMWKLLLILVSGWVRDCHYPQGNVRQF